MLPYKNSVHLTTKGNPVPRIRKTIRAIWTGTAGLFLTDAKTSLYVDPFVSYQSMFGIITGKLRIHNTAIENTIAQLIHHSGNPDGIFISHSHYDHILDVPVFADDWEKDERKKGRKKDIIPVYGSDSAGNYLWHFPEISKKFQLLQSEKEISLGNWKITGLESEHGKAVLGRIAYAGEITKKSPRPVRARDFRMGKIYSFMMQISGVTIVHHGSAGFRKGMYDGKRADILFLGVAGWKYSREYLAETIGMLQPKVVVPIHFDNFFHKRFQPETDKKPQILWDVSLEKFMRKVEREYPQTRLILLEPGGSIIWNHTAGKTGKKKSPAD